MSHYQNLKFKVNKLDVITYNDKARPIMSKCSEVNQKACHYEIIGAKVKNNYANLAYATMIPQVEICFIFLCLIFNLRADIWLITIEIQ